MKILQLITLFLITTSFAGAVAHSEFEKTQTESTDIILRCTAHRCRAICISFRDTINALPEECSPIDVYTITKKYFDKLDIQLKKYKKRVNILLMIKDSDPDTDNCIIQGDINRLNQPLEDALEPLNEVKGNLPILIPPSSKKIPDSQFRNGMYCPASGTSLSENLEALSSLFPQTVMEKKVIPQADPEVDSEEEMTNAIKGVEKFFTDAGMPLISRHPIPAPNHSILKAESILKSRENNEILSTKLKSGENNGKETKPQDTSDGYFPYRYLVDPNQWFMMSDPKRFRQQKAFRELHDPYDYIRTLEMYKKFEKEWYPPVGTQIIMEYTGAQQKAKFKEYASPEIKKLCESGNLYYFKDDIDLLNKIRESRIKLLKLFQLPDSNTNPHIKIVTDIDDTAKEMLSIAKKLRAQLGMSPEHWGTSTFNSITDCPMTWIDPKLPYQFKFRQIPPQHFTDLYEIPGCYSWIVSLSGRMWYAVIERPAIGQFDLKRTYPCERDSSIYVLPHQLTCLFNSSYTETLSYIEININKSLYDYPQLLRVYENNPAIFPPNIISSKDEMKIVHAIPDTHFDAVDKLNKEEKVKYLRENEGRGNILYCLGLSHKPLNISTKKS